jgi:hypothetical protein
MAEHKIDLKKMAHDWEEGESTQRLIDDTEPGDRRQLSGSSRLVVVLVATNIILAVLLSVFWLDGRKAVPIYSTDFGK